MIQITGGATKSHYSGAKVALPTTYAVLRKVISMRSDIVFDALQTKNRFELCHQTFKAIRLLHKNNTRIEDTANDVLMRLAATEPKKV